MYDRVRSCPVTHINVKLDDDLIHALDQYQQQNALETRSQALRHLMRMVLVSTPKPPKPPKPRRPR